jgi:hypothetical protein
MLRRFLRREAFNPAKRIRASVVDRRFCFVIIPGHETASVEKVVERHDDYFVVEKVGEAREQLERDHPQQRHRPPGPE